MFMTYGKWTYGLDERGGRETFIVEGPGLVTKIRDIRFKGALNLMVPQSMNKE